MKKQHPADKPIVVPVRGRVGQLSPRQSQIAGLIAQDLTDEVIATALGLSKETVREHIKKIIKRLKADGRDIRSRVGIAVWYVSGVV